MRTKESAIKYAKKYLAEASKHDVKIEKAYLFGSYAKGLQNKFSDIDVAIVSKDFSENPLDNWQKIASANIRYHHVEPHVFSYKRFKKGDPFLAEIVKTGIQIS